jgi:hypothetical protein
MNKKQLIEAIKKWLKDFERTQPSNVSLPYDDDETFEGSAYLLLQNTLYHLTEKQHD